MLPHVLADRQVGPTVCKSASAVVRHLNSQTDFGEHRGFESKPAELASLGQKTVELHLVNGCVSVGELPVALGVSDVG